MNEVVTAGAAADGPGAEHLASVAGPVSAMGGDTTFRITDATADDIAGIAALAARRRADYQVAQPQFWRPAVDAVEQHVPWLRTLIEDVSVVALVARHRESLGGFAIASIAEAPAVYDPGGPTGVVDDFVVADPSLWPTLGRDLLTEVRRRLVDRGVVQVVVVCGRQDSAKRAALQSAGLSVASEWFVGPSSP